MEQGLSRPKQDTSVVDRLVSHVTVVDRRHALCGQRFEVASLRSGRGPAFIVIRLPDGRSRNIRRTVTDLSSASDDDREHRMAVGKLISVRTLLPLVYYARITFSNSMASCDGCSCFGASDCRVSTGDQCSTGKDQTRYAQLLEQSPTSISAPSRADARDSDPPDAAERASGEGAV